MKRLVVILVLLLVAVGGLEYLRQRVTGALAVAVTGSDREQVQVMIAQNGDRAVAEGADEAQDAERIRTTIHQIAHQQQAIGSRLEADERVARILLVLDVILGEALKFLLQEPAAGLRAKRNFRQDVIEPMLGHLTARQQAL